jgi:hypothetical protein
MDIDRRVDVTTGRGCEHAFGKVHLARTIGYRQLRHTQDYRPDEPGLDDFVLIAAGSGLSSAAGRSQHGC